jgi:hypothetical protein
VKSAPNPSTLEVTGTILVGSWIEFVSSGLLALIMAASAEETTLFAPVILT